MEVRRVQSGDNRRSRCRAVNHERSSLVGRPSRRIGLRGHAIAFPERRPPSLFESSFPRRRVGRADGKAGDAVIVFGDKRQLWFEQGVGRRVDVPHQPGIGMEM